MSYRPPKRSLLGAHVSQRAAVVLSAWLPDDVVFKRTATMPEDLRLEVLNTLDAIKAAAVMHKQAFAESAEVGNRPAAITPEQEESTLKGMHVDPAGNGVLLPIGEAGALLGLKSRRVRQLCKSGELEAVKPGGSWLISREAIDQYLAINQIRRTAA